MKLSFNFVKTARMLVTIAFLTTSSNTFSMSWLKKMLGFKAAQSSVSKNDSIITIEEKDNIGHLIFKMTNIPYSDNTPSTKKFGTVTFDIDLCQNKANISCHSDTNNQVFKYDTGDLWFMRSLFLGFNGALLENKAKIIKNSCPINLLKVTLNPGDPGYASAFDAYWQCIKNNNTILDKVAPSKNIQLLYAPRDKTLTENILLGSLLSTMLMIGCGAALAESK